MTDPTPHTTGKSLEQLLERVVFEDPATHAIRSQWEETKRTEREVYDRICREEYERRLEYHRICQTPNPEEAARHETDLCKILFREELEERLAVRWAETLHRVQAVLAQKAAASSEATSGSGRTGGEHPPGT